MAPSLYAYSIVIHFSLTKENEEQKQPFSLQATTPKHIYKSSLIQAHKAQISNGSIEKQDDEQPVFFAINNPATNINIVLHSNTSAAISNKYCAYFTSLLV
ncbi:hypothetical protein NC652_004740 [Populus alba x Populus x berolinensis]|nr:hypothetical protein NC652_004740 [Populus alba x Populus x berolinensis]